MGEHYFESEPLAEAIAEKAGTYDAPLVIFEAAVEMLKARDAEISRLLTAVADLEEGNCILRARLVDTGRS